MSTQIEMFDNSELAFSSYSDLQVGSTSTSGQIDALKQNNDGMSQTESVKFSSRYPNVIAVQPNTDSGFSATVFMAAGTNQLTVALRGTETGNPEIWDDLFSADMQLSAYGVAYHQVVDMYNWWQKVTHTGMVDQYEMVSSITTVEGGVLLYEIKDNDHTPANNMKTYLVKKENQEQASGELVGQTDINSVTVTGHSLGGHLASAFTALFSGQVEHTYTYNAPGFTDTATNTTFFAELGGYTPFDSAVTSKVTRVLANNALPGETQADFIQDLHGGTPANATVTVAIEDLGDINTENHSIVTVTDSLAVFNLLAKMDSSLTMEQYNAVFHAASNTEKNVDTLETLIDTLQKLFGLGSATLLTNDREAFYQALYGVQDKITAGTDASGQFTISQTATIVDARTDFGVFLSVIPSASACSLAA